MTVSATVVACVSAPLVPVMVSVKGPVLVPVVVETVSVDVAVGLGVTGVGSVHVAPDGHPVTLRPTLPLKPFKAVTVTVDVPDAPCVSVSDVGLRDTEKSGAVPHEENLKDPKKVLQLKVPFVCKYSFVYQKVQSSEGSIRIAL